MRSHDSCGRRRRRRRRVGLDNSGLIRRRPQRRRRRFCDNRFLGRISLFYRGRVLGAFVFVRIRALVRVFSRLQVRDAEPGLCSGLVGVPRW